MQNKFEVLVKIYGYIDGLGAYAILGVIMVHSAESVSSINQSSQFFMVL